METMDICIATYKLYEGNGIDVSVAQFAKELSRDHNVKIAVVSSDMCLQGIEILKYQARDPLKIKPIARELEKQRFDIISTHFFPFDVVASMTRIPHFLHDAGVPPLSTISSVPDLLFWSAVNASRLISSRNPEIVLPVSNYLGSEFIRKYHYRGKMKVLPHGIEFPDSEAMPAGQEFDKFILYVGRHVPYKGVHKLIEIFGEVKKEMGDHVHLVTIGRGDPGYERRLRALADKTGNVHMLGYVPDVWPYYAGASVYATCSSWEGLDRPVIEAQYQGKPVVSYNNCSHPEVVLNGTLVSDDRSFKEALIKHLSEDKADRSIRVDIVERYSTKRMARDFIDIAKKI